MMRSSTEAEEISPQLRRAFTFIVPAGFNHPKTRTHVRLLGPCFKTGRKKPFSHRHGTNLKPVIPPESWSVAMEVGIR